MSDTSAGPGPGPLPAVPPDLPPAEPDPPTRSADDLLQALAESGTGEAKLDVLRAAIAQAGRGLTAAEGVEALERANDPPGPDLPPTGRVGEGTLAKARAFAATGRIPDPRPGPPPVVPPGRPPTDYHLWLTAGRRADFIDYVRKAFAAVEEVGRAADPGACWQAVRVAVGAFADAGGALAAAGVMDRVVGADDAGEQAAELLRWGAELWPARHVVATIRHGHFRGTEADRDRAAEASVRCTDLLGDHIRRLAGRGAEAVAGVARAAEGVVRAALGCADPPAPDRPPLFMGRPKRLQTGAGPAPGPLGPAHPPPGSASDFAAAYARERAEWEREETEARAAFEERVAGPARQLRPAWDVAWSRLSAALGPVCEAIRECRPCLYPVEPAAVADALAEVGRTLPRLDAIREARVEINPSLHDFTLRERGVPIRPTERLARVRDDDRFNAPAPRAAAELLLRAASDPPEELAGRVRLLLADARLRVAFGWLPFIRDCLWPRPAGRISETILEAVEPDDPIGPGPGCEDWQQRITVRDYQRAEILLTGNVPVGPCDLFPEWHPEPPAPSTPADLRAHCLSERALLPSWNWFGGEYDYGPRVAGVWEHLVRIAAGRPYPPLEAGHYDLVRAQAAIDRVIGWCDGPGVAAVVPGGAGESVPAPAPKRSTEPGEGRAKLIAALTEHHRYADGGSLNTDPVGNNALAKAAGVSPSTASAFFTDQFKGHAQYRALCRDAGRLAAALKLLNGEFSPHLLYDRREDEGHDGD
jgi:hypothetical protein